MEMQNFFSVCIYLTIGLMVFCLALNFFVVLNIFGVGQIGPEMGNNSSADVQRFTQNPEFPSGMTMGAIWAIVLSASTGVGILLSWLTQDASLLGVFIFSGVFWSSYINAMTIINAMLVIPGVILGLFTVPIFFLFIAAVIGMLSGV